MFKPFRELLTIKNAVFSAAIDQDSTGIRLSGEGKELEVKRLLFDNVVFDGFSRGLRIGNDVHVGDAVRIVNSGFGGSRNELEIPREKLKIEGSDLVLPGEN